MGSNLIPWLMCVPFVVFLMLSGCYSKQLNEIKNNQVEMLRKLDSKQTIIYPNFNVPMPKNYDDRDRLMIDTGCFKAY